MLALPLKGIVYNDIRSITCASCETLIYNIDVWTICVYYIDNLNENMPFSMHHFTEIL